MSGGFFRGTSADQDTRFSNKMSKLLKSQKFAPELDVLVEMAKVKIDVIKPWIATRVTELLGFEDEVLINFIYGLLDVKEADGKHLQIQLTGFMEKNTGRFMKELWALLTSAQNNLSGVPQQFLDAKAEEAKKKKDEKDRILSEVLRKKEEQEKDAEEERQRRQIAKEESGKANLEKRGTSGSPDKVFDGKSSGGRNGRGARKTSISPRGSRSPSSSTSRGSPPIRHRRARSISRSPRRRRLSISPIRRRSPVQRRSPLLPRSPHRRRRSPLYSRSPPRRGKSPPGRTPPRIRSRSPRRISRRSPGSLHSPSSRRRGSTSPPRIPRRSPGGLPSPPRWHGSRTPPRVLKRSPVGLHSPPPRRYGSRSPPRLSRRSPVSLHSPPRRHLGPPWSPPMRRRSPTGSGSPPFARGSPSRSPYVRHRSLSRDRVIRRSRSPPRKRQSLSRERGVPLSRSPYQRRRSPSRDLGGPNTRSPFRNRTSPSRDRGRRNGLDARDRDRLARESERLERRSDRPDKRDPPDQRPPLTREHDRLVPKEGHDSRSSGAPITGEKRSHPQSEEWVDPEPAEHERSNHRDVDVTKAIGKSVYRLQGPGDGALVASDEVKKTGERKEVLAKAVSDSDDEDVQPTRPQKVSKRVNDISDDVGDEEGSESPGSSDGRRAAKRRRKEEKRMRKEERRKRRDEKHRRREEKRALKAAKASTDIDVNSEDIETKPQRLDDNHPGPREGSGLVEVYRSKDGDSEDEQKRIERELRNKALESLRAKKGIVC